MFILRCQKVNNKKTSKLSENEKKQVLFLSLSMVFSITFMLILLLFLTVTLHESGTIKAIFWSKTVYNKNLSSQCNPTAQIKPMHDKNVIIYSKTNLLVTRYDSNRMLLLKISQTSPDFFLVLAAILKILKTHTCSSNGDLSLCQILFLYHYPFRSYQH